MTVKRLLLALPSLALLVGCGGDAPTDDGRAASGDVLEGTISDEMLPVDRVRSEPPLEDPEAFEEAHSSAGGAEPAGEGSESEEGAEAEPPATEATSGATPQAAPEAGDE